MNAVIACLISNLSMNSDSVSFSFVLALLICCIQLYVTLSSFLSSVYFIPTLRLSFYISWRPGVAYISLFHSCPILFIFFLFFFFSFAVVSCLCLFHSWDLVSISLLLVPFYPSHIPMMRVRATTSILGHQT